MEPPANSTTCSLTTYNQWYELPYEDAAQANIIESELMTYYSIRRDEAKTWEIMEFDKTQLEYRRGRGSISNGQAMELSTEWCQTGLASLLTELAGGHGPVSDQDLHDTMCSYCYLSDDLRTIAMNISSCDCLQLSTLPEDLAYIRDGDFCRKNSGHLLCEAFPKRCSQEDCLLKPENARSACPNQIVDEILDYQQSGKTSLDMLVLGWMTILVLFVCSVRSIMVMENVAAGIKVLLSGLALAESLPWLYCTDQFLKMKRRRFDGARPMRPIKSGKGN